MQRPLDPFPNALGKAVIISHCLGGFSCQGTTFLQLGGDQLFKTLDDFKKIGNENDVFPRLSPSRGMSRDNNFQEIPRLLPPGLQVHWLLFSSFLWICLGRFI